MSRPTLLIVDDERAIRASLARLLKDEYIVLEAGSGRAAIEILEDATSPTVDAVLTDLDMAEGSGEMLYRWIVANRPALEPRVLLMSGSSANLKKLQIPPEDRRFRKPFDVDAVRARLKEVIASGYASLPDLSTGQHQLNEGLEPTGDHPGS